MPFKAVGGPCRSRHGGRFRPPRTRHGPPDLRARRPSRPSRPACTAAVTAQPTCLHGGRHGPPDQPARHPSRPTRPPCTAPVTAPARTPHGSLHGPPTAPCTAYHGFLPRRSSRAPTPGAPVITSSIRRSNLPPPGFRWCGDRATTTPSTAPARPFTAFSRRSQVLRRGAATECLG